MKEKSNRWTQAGLIITGRKGWFYDLAAEVIGIVRKVRMNLRINKSFTLPKNGVSGLRPEFLQGV
jgi:hypothetical protein